ncbi:MAG: helix-turn-helix transcriptional regulator [Bacteroidaceae bacterium]|nr:helix-turn-helix transcriptional regulator [Bacteroidaceae bacterium]
MNIKKVIKEKGWTLEMLAAKMTKTEIKDGVPTTVQGVSQATVSQILNGNPTLDKLKEIASIMDISVSELVSDGELETAIHCPRCGEKIIIKAE